MNKPQLHRNTGSQASTDTTQAGATTDTNSTGTTQASATTDTNNTTQKNPVWPSVWASLRF